jgi:hypothetical protein
LNNEPRGRELVPPSDWESMVGTKTQQEVGCHKAHEPFMRRVMRYLFAG